MSIPSDRGPGKLVISTLAERPDLADRLTEIPSAVAGYLYHDPVSVALYELVTARYPEFCLVGVEPAAPDRPVAQVCSLPFSWPRDPARELPPEGYDAVLLGAAADGLAGRRGNLAAAILVAVHPELRGHGLSHHLVAAVRRNAAGLGFRSLVVPARPTRKHEQPGVPLADYLAWTRPDGLPVDPWLRVHVRAGGQIVGIAPRSMTIAAPLDQWRAWTGLPFDVTGPVPVPDGLVPAHCDTVHDIGVYVEPNVWVHHPLT